MKSLQEHIVAHPKLGMVVPVEHARGLIEQARREAFEEAAKVFETMQATAWPDEIAAAIRARGEAK